MMCLGDQRINTESAYKYVPIGMTFPVQLKKEEKEYKIPLPQNNTALSDNVVKWFKNRGISQRVLIEMKVSEPNEYRYLHHIVYESEFGAIPKGHVVIFRDSDTTNIHPDNLALLSRRELALLNHEFDLKKSDPSIKPTVLAVMKLKSKINEIKNVQS